MALCSVNAGASRGAACLPPHLRPSRRHAPHHRARHAAGSCDGNAGGGGAGGGRESGAGGGRIWGGMLSASRVSFLRELPAVFPPSPACARKRCEPRAVCACVLYSPWCKNGGRDGTGKNKLELWEVPRFFRWKKNDELSTLRCSFSPLERAVPHFPPPSLPRPHTPHGGRHARVSPPSRSRGPCQTQPVVGFLLRFSRRPSCPPLPARASFPRPPMARCRLPTTAVATLAPRSLGQVGGEKAQEGEL